MPTRATLGADSAEPVPIRQGDSERFGAAVLATAGLGVLLSACSGDDADAGAQAMAQAVSPPLQPQLLPHAGAVAGVSIW